MRRTYGLPPHRIRIITPYLAQVKLLERELAKLHSGRMLGGQRCLLQQSAHACEYHTVAEKIYPSPQYVQTEGSTVQALLAGMICSIRMLQSITPIPDVHKDLAPTSTATSTLIFLERYIAVREDFVKARGTTSAKRWPISCAAPPGKSRDRKLVDGIHAQAGQGAGCPLTSWKRWLRAAEAQSRSFLWLWRRLQSWTLAQPNSGI